ncbi:MAG: hypothetical protein KF777_18780 [Planctomycetaceae bacterium]|nr:hypothetical protein [Planctomycetaceae bacterium]
MAQLAFGRRVGGVVDFSGLVAGTPATAHAGDAEFVLPLRRAVAGGWFLLLQ